MKKTPREREREKARFFDNPRDRERRRRSRTGHRAGGRGLCSFVSFEGASRSSSTSRSRATICSTVRSHEQIRNDEANAGHGHSLHALYRIAREEATGRQQPWGHVETEREPDQPHPSRTGVRTSMPGSRPREPIRGGFAGEGTEGRKAKRRRPPLAWVLHAPARKGTIRAPCAVRRTHP